MYSINDDEIEFILDDIEKRGIMTEDVRYNILDHVCCIIENEMPNGGNFKEFYKNTIARFYKNELSEIEDETRDLLTFKYYYAMKRTLKVSGVISIVLSLVGSIFKVQHLPGAGILLLTGIAFFSLVFVPLNIVLKLRDEKETKNKLIMTLGLSTVMIGTIGIIFKIMHWPGANVLILSSFAAFILAFIPAYFIIKFKDPDSKFNAIIHTTFMIAGTAMLYALMYQGPSLNVKDSVKSMDEFQANNVEQLEKNNTSIYAEISTGQDQDVLKLTSYTRELNEKIGEIQANLIAKSNHISIEEARGLKTTDLINSNDFGVVETHFARAEGNLSYAALKSAVTIYNEGIMSLSDPAILRPVDIDQLQMTNTLVSVVMHELGDIQIQILSNENSYLSMRKGLLVER